MHKLSNKLKKQNIWEIPTRNSKPIWGKKTPNQINIKNPNQSKACQIKEILAHTSAKTYKNTKSKLQ